MDQLLAIIFPFFNLLLQSYPRIFNKLFGVDVWTRLLETDHIRKNNHRIPKEKLSEQFIIDGYFDYPPAFPFLLSFFPKKTLLKLQGFIAPFFDSLQVLLVYFVTFYITGDIAIALTAQFIYMLTPMIALENSYLTPRSFGYLNFSLAVIPLIFFMIGHNILFFGMGTFFTTLLFLTHRFALQSFLFLSIFFTFFFNTPIFIQSLILGFTFTTILTKGYYLRVLKGHFYNILFWVHNLDYRFAHQIRGVMQKETKTDWVGKVYLFISIFSPIAVFGLNPWSLSGFMILIAYTFHWLSFNPIFYIFSIWILFFYFLGVIVLKTKQLMPIGEGQRYMEMATVPSAVLSSYLLFELLKTSYKIPTLTTIVVLSLINLFLIIFVQIKGVIKDKNRSVTDDWTKIFTYINKQKNQLRIICIPHQNTTMTIYHTKAAVFVNADNPGLMRVQEVYPILKLPLKHLAKKYNLTHALIKESFVTLKELHVSEKYVEFSSGDIKLVKLN